MVPLFLYTLMTIILSPIIFILIVVRILRKKEDLSRLNERLGWSKKKRPEGRLIWLHGASVGECLSMMPLINEILRRDSNVHVMVTSGTKTSAALMAKRLPERAFHQYIPIDFPWATRRFVKHWNADLVLWFESDFWPNMLKSVSKNKKPFVLLNGRISDRSFDRWCRAKFFITPLLRLFTLCFGQTQEDAHRLEGLGAKQVVCVGNLKFSAVNPPYDGVELNDLLAQIGSRPRCIAASTHAGEEEMIAGFHNDVKRAFPSFLSVIVPRHPERADELEAMLVSRGFVVSRRSRGDQITLKTDIYLADTIGEMGLLYRLAPIVFVGGSLVPFGGQNMLEPMRLGRLVMVGPYTFNFREIVKQASEEGALVRVQTASEVLGNAVRYLTHPDEMEPVMARAQAFATSQMAVLDRVYELLRERVGL